MERPFDVIGLIAASSSRYCAGAIPLIRARTISITLRVTCGAALNADPKVEIYYSPDGNNWDSIAYTSFTLANSAGNIIQRTVVVDPPEHGYLQVKITNQSAADSMSANKLWYSIQSAFPMPQHSRGKIETKEQTD